ncbi:nucleoside monophosphate kinase [Candidatus Uhrbacteria bacterium]|nr:MAG: nucleoside monophosphate kinase [Candidatus Uhrbacteria bacterium]
MRRKRLRAVFFGPQGSGKSQQAALLAERFDVSLVSSGEAFREEIGEKTAIGDLVSEYVEAGIFAPDELVNAILTKRLKRLDSEAGFVLDGYPRNVEQAETLDRLARVTLAIQLKISDVCAVKRLANRVVCTTCRATLSRDGVETPEGFVPCPVCGDELVTRPKDEEEAVRRRLAAYHFMTEPLAGYYRQRGVLLAVNGEQAVGDLFDELTRKLAKLGFVA